MDTFQSLEDIETIDWDKVQGLVPAIIQDKRDQQVLMLGYMNPAALQQTLHEKRVTFFSRQKNRLWTKGESSGHFLTVHEILFDCDKDTLLVQVEPMGPTCHTGSRSCFTDMLPSDFLLTLEKTIMSRKGSDPSVSYTADLFLKGKQRIAQKVGEEAIEVILAAQDESDPKAAIVSETADLLFHLLVFLNVHHIHLNTVIQELKQRHAIS